MIIVVGRVRCAEAEREGLVAAGKVMQEKSREEDGCIRYDFFTALDDPLSFIAVEEWRDRPALDVHFTQPHLQEFSEKLGTLISEAPEVAIHRVEGTSDYPG